MTLFWFDVFDKISILNLYVSWTDFRTVFKVLSKI